MINPKEAGVQAKQDHLILTLDMADLYYSHTSMYQLVLFYRSSKSQTELTAWPLASGLTSLQLPLTLLNAVICSS